MAIHFHFQKPVLLQQRRKLKAFLSRKVDEKRRTVDVVNYIFCSDEELLDINRRFLNHNTYTDIITFHYHQPGRPVQSDIYISVDRVKENAQKFRTNLSTELHRVIFHGMLHLLGFKDKSEREAKTMRSMEDQWLSEYCST